MRTLTTTSHSPRSAAAFSPRATGRFAHVRRAAAELPSDAIEQVAQRVVQLLRYEPHSLNDGPGVPGELMDAGQLARYLGLNRAWVYEHADALGAIQLGDGPRPRLRFDPQIAVQALKTRQRRNEPEPANTARRPGRPRRRPESSSVPLLPIHERRALGAFARRLCDYRRSG